MRYRCYNCGRSPLRRNGTDLYYTASYFLDDDCECRQIKAKEPAIDAVVLEELKG